MVWLLQMQWELKIMTSTSGGRVWGTLVRRCYLKFQPLELQPPGRMHGLTASLQLWLPEVDWENACVRRPRWTESIVRILSKPFRCLCLISVITSVCLDGRFCLSIPWLNERKNNLWFYWHLHQSCLLFVKDMSWTPHWPIEPKFWKLYF